MSQQSVNNYGVGFLQLLTIIFVVLKLTGNIDWSWWWVFSPLLLNVFIWIVFLIVLFICLYRKEVDSLRRRK